MITAPYFHTMVIHFPIALIMVGFLSELVGLATKKEFLKITAFYLLLLGSLGAVVAYISGSYAGVGMMDGILQKPMELPEEAAEVTFWLSVITALFRVSLYYFKFRAPWAK